MCMSAAGVMVDNKNQRSHSHSLIMSRDGIIDGLTYAIFPASPLSFSIIMAVVYLVLLDIMIYILFIAEAVGRGAGASKRLYIGKRTLWPGCRGLVVVALLPVAYVGLAGLSRVAGKQYGVMVGGCRVFPREDRPRNLTLLTHTPESMMYGSRRSSRSL